MALFADTCIAHGGDVAGLRAALAARGIPAMPDDHARPLLVRPGRVFSVGARAGHLAVLSFDDGHCGTVAEDIDPGRLLTALAAAMKARGIAVSSVGRTPQGAAAAYRLDGPHTHLALMVNMQPIGDRTQASMLAAPLP